MFLSLFVFDILLANILLPVIISLRFVEPEPIVLRGFSCDDLSIRLPYRPDTISETTMYGSLIIGAFLLIVLVECVTSWIKCRYSSCIKTTLVSWYQPVAYYSVKMLALFAFGFEVVFLMMTISKLTVGRLRPHFIDVCKPDFSRINCSIGYVSEFTCVESVSPRLINDARQSFLSGHAAMSTFTAIYLACYLERRLSRDNKAVQVLKLLTQMSLISVALFISLSRVADNKHHPSDVFAGAVLGTIVAVWMVSVTDKTVADNPSFNYNKSAEDCETPDNDNVNKSRDMHSYNYGSNSSFSSTADIFCSQQQSEKSKLLIKPV